MPTIRQLIDRYRQFFNTQVIMLTLLRILVVGFVVVLFVIAHKGTSLPTTIEQNKKTITFEHITHYQCVYHGSQGDIVCSKAPGFNSKVSCYRILNIDGLSNLDILPNPYAAFWFEED